MEEYQTYLRNGKLVKRKYVDKNTTHGMSRSRIWREWKGMRCRCNNSNTPYYKFYGEKGVKVFPEWDYGHGGFENFYKWAIENGYSDDLSLDRIDPNGNYYPENCRWIPLSENMYRAVNKPHRAKWKYFAYNENEKTLLIFYKIQDFEDFTGLNSRRVSDGCKSIDYEYKGWKFKKEPVDTIINEGVETIPFGSTLEDKLPAEVRVVHLPIKMDEDIVHTA